MDFIRQNVILSENIANLSYQQSILRALSKIDTGYIQILVAILCFALTYSRQIILSQNQAAENSWAQAQSELMKKFNFKYGTSLRNIDPFADNLVVFYFHKSMAMFFNIWHDLVTREKPAINDLFSKVPDFEKNENFYNLVLIGSAIFLQFCLVYVPITHIVDTIHKNKS